MEHFIVGKVIIITGGSSGIGLEAAKMLLKMGAQVIITGKNEPKLKAAELSLKPFADDGKTEVISIRADARVPGDWDTLFASTLAKYGRIDVLVNNHGAAIKKGNLVEHSDEEIEEVTKYWGYSSF